MSVGALALSGVYAGAGRLWVPCPMFLLPSPPTLTIIGPVAHKTR
jgi:hypothetical protein